MSILHAMIMTNDLSPRSKHTIEKDKMSRLCVMNLLSDILQLHYTDAKLLRLSPTHKSYKPPTRNKKMKCEL